MATSKSPPAEGSELRQRTTASSKATTNGSTKTQSPPEKAAPPASSSWSISALDIFRALAGIALLSTVASYAVTQGESFTWGLSQNRPWWLDLKKIERAIKGPMLLTNDELSAYDGSDPSKPILLAINRTIYDVSESPNIYGPGGAYSALAAKDASRSYVTTCFDPVDDLVPYLGGVEEIFVPLWLSKKPLPALKADYDAIGRGEIAAGKDAEDIIDTIQKKIGRKNVKPLQKKAYEAARQRVADTIKNWEDMLGKKYPIVGKVIGVDEEDPTKWRHLAFCETARKMRPAMGESITEAFKSVGKEDKLSLNMGQAMKKYGAKPKKKKYGKKGKKSSDTGTSTEEKVEELDPESEAKAQARVDDMVKGGKYYEANKDKGMSMEDIMKYGPRGMKDDKNAARANKILEKARKNSKQSRGGIPDAVPDEAVDDMPMPEKDSQPEPESVTS